MAEKTSPNRRRFLRGLPFAAAGLSGTASGENAKSFPDPQDMYMQLHAIENMLGTYDPGQVERAGAALDNLTVHMPEARDLLTLRHLYAAKGSVFRPAVRVDINLITQACRTSTVLNLHYTDGAGQTTQRTVRPLEIVYPEAGTLLLGWCDLRQGFRQFYLHRIDRVTLSSGSFAQNRPVLIHALLKHSLDQRYSDAGF